jgi:hypothetical protein
MLRFLFISVLAASSTLPMLSAPAVSFSDFQPNGTINNFTRGWVFDVVSPSGILVTHLGLFDQDGEGLIDDHEIGIWDAEGNLLASALLEAGDESPLDEAGLFRLVRIPGLLLPAAKGYRIGAVYERASLDLQAIQVTGLTVNPAIRFAGAVRSPRSGTAELEFPLDADEFFDPGIFGPSFEFSQVPEPSTVLSVLVGLVLLRGRIKRR